RPTPVQVSGLSGMTAVAAGQEHSLAVKSDGTVWAWGYNWAGQLGDGTTTSRPTPVQVSGLSGMTAVAAGQEHSLAVKSDGTVWAWGDNFNGQLGDGTTTRRFTPVQVSSLSNVVAVAGGSSHSLVRKGDGTVWAWGYNNRGQLGDGTTTSRSVPVQVSGLSNVVAVAAGQYHSLATAATPPTAADDAYTTGAGTTLAIAAPGVLSNDTNAAGGTLTAAKVTDPSHGTLALSSNGSFSYTPATGYVGVDSFTYKANNGNLDSNVATVTITINNLPPSAAADSYATGQGTTLGVAAPGVLANDSDPGGDAITAVKVADPSHGTATLNANGSFTYSPTAGWSGTDSFTYRANDGSLDSDVATVSIAAIAPPVGPTPTAGTLTFSSFAGNGYARAGSSAQPTTVALSQSGLTQPQLVGDGSAQTLLDDQVQVFDPGTASICSTAIASARRNQVDYSQASRTWNWTTHFEADANISPNDPQCPASSAQAANQGTFISTLFAPAGTWTFSYGQTDSPAVNSSGTTRVRLISSTNPSLVDHSGATSGGPTTLTPVDVQSTGEYFTIIVDGSASAATSTTAATWVGEIAIGIRLPTQLQTTLSVDPASAVYGGTTSLSATLLANGTGVAGSSVSFTLNGASVGSATTNPSGVATLSGVSVAGIDASATPYAGYVGASFAGDSGYGSSSGSASLTVNKASQAITFTSTPPPGATYGGSFTATATGGLSGNTVTFSSGSPSVCSVSGTGAVSFVGTGTCTVLADQAGNSNYGAAPQQSQSFSISAKPAAVVANPQTKSYGDENPSLTASVTGTVGSDTLTYSLGTTAQALSGIGSYPISVSLGSNPNYVVTKTDSSLAVNARAATVVADAKAKTYGDANPELTAVVTGAVEGGDPIAYSLSTTAPQALSGVGSYPITVSLGSNPNYLVTATDSTLSITPAPLEVKADDVEKPYGYTLTFAGTEFTASGLVNGDTVTSVTLTSAGAVDTADVAGSPYDIVPSAAVGSGLSNYAITHAPGKLTVAQPTAETTSVLVVQYVAQQGVASSMTSELNSIQRAINRGNPSATTGAANAFINHVNAQTGKTVTPEEAAILIKAAKLMAGIP
ncbi:MAG: tandem-95 repeat protein, partial [Chloroflexi bacterium]|nr:tandem-95 repeat protein [Chloroflexota bacterium]